METRKIRKINVINFAKKLKKGNFSNITENNLRSNKKFWQFVKPFLTNKGAFGADFILIKKDNPVDR